MAISDHAEKQHAPVQALRMLQSFAKPTYIIIIIYCTALRIGKMGKPSPCVAGVLFYQPCCRNDVLAINSNSKRVAGEGRGRAKGLFLGFFLKHKSSLIVGQVQDSLAVARAQ